MGPLILKGILCWIVIKWVKVVKITILTDLTCFLAKSSNKNEDFFYKFYYFKP